MLVLANALGLACSSEPASAPASSPNPSVAQGQEAPPVVTADCHSHAALDVAALPPLPEGDHVATFELVWRTLLEKHFDPTLSCLDWPQVRLDFGARVAAAKDGTQAYDIINEMLATLGQSHMAVWGPVERDETLLEPLGSGTLPLRTALIRDDVVVSATTLDGHTSGLPAGALVIKVGERAMPEVIKAGRDAARGEGSQELGASRAVAAALTCEPGTSRDVVYLDPTSGDSQHTKSVPCVEEFSQRVTLGNIHDLPTRVEWRMLDEKVGYLAFNYWMVPMVQQLTTGMQELRSKGMTALVLDLRGNPGGVGAMAIPVARMLMAEPGTLGALRMRDFSQELRFQGDGDPFRGPVALLVDGGTASTSEIFALGLRDLDRVVVVGARNSAGLALPSLIEQLPDGGSFQYVVGDYVSSQGHRAEGDGIKPDLLIEVTRAPYIQGVDPVIDAARTHLQGKLTDVPLAPTKGP